MKKILSIILSITMLLSMGTVALADGVDGPMQKAKIKVAISADFPPFEYYDENEELYGFDIDLMNYIGDRIGFDIEFVNMSFDQLFSAVMGGDVDCAISAIAVTEERNNVIDYTIPYLSAKVTYSDEESTDTSIEKYAIVFPNNSVEKANVLETAGQIAIYNLVNDALIALIENKTVEKLGEKYNLNKAADTDDFDYEYTVVSVPTDLPNDENDTSAERDVLAGATTIAAPSDWAKESVDIAYAIGIPDRADYQFANPITREEFCEMIYNLIVAIKKEISATHPQNFTDTTNRKMLVLSGLGIINGKSETSLAPNDYLTREEAATIIIRMINKVMPMAATEMWFEYDDINEVSEWASDSIQTISNLGFMNGVGDNKFAPKETYTTEQAIATLVRVYERAESAGAIDNSSIGIIGGADGPTSIIVGDNTINVDKKQEYDNFYVEVKKNTKKVDKFYIDEAIKLTTESGTLASDEEFIRYYAPSKDIDNKVLSIGAADYSKPTEVYYMSANREQIINNIKALSSEELDGFDIEKLLKLNRIDFSVIGNLINASYGAENLAALTILTNSRGYVMPKDFTDDFAIYLQYDGEYSALVSFSKFGDGVIKATMSFVNNGERDNIFRRIYEITQGLGENSIDVAVVR